MVESRRSGATSRNRTGSPFLCLLNRFHRKTALRGGIGNYAARLHRSEQEAAITELWLPYLSRLAYRRYNAHFVTEVLISPDVREPASDSSTTFRGPTLGKGGMTNINIPAHAAIAAAARKGQV